MDLHLNGGWWVEGVGNFGISLVYILKARKMMTVGATCRKMVQFPFVPPSLLLIPILHSHEHRDEALKGVRNKEF